MNQFCVSSVDSSSATFSRSSSTDSVTIPIVFILLYYERGGPLLESSPEKCRRTPVTNRVLIASDRIRTYTTKFLRLVPLPYWATEAKTGLSNIYVADCHYPTGTTVPDGNRTRATTCQFCLENNCCKSPYYLRGHSSLIYFKKKRANRGRNRSFSPVKEEQDTYLD